MLSAGMELKRARLLCGEWLLAISRIYSHAVADKASSESSSSSSSSMNESFSSSSVSKNESSSFSSSIPSLSYMHHARTPLLACLELLFTKKGICQLGLETTLPGAGSGSGSVSGKAGTRTDAGPGADAGYKRGLGNGAGTRAEAGFGQVFGLSVCVEWVSNSSSSSSSNSSSNSSCREHQHTAQHLFFYSNKEALLGAAVLLKLGDRPCRTGARGLLDMLSNNNSSNNSSNNNISSIASSSSSSSSLIGRSSSSNNAGITISSANARDLPNPTAASVSVLGPVGSNIRKRAQRLRIGLCSEG